MGCHQERPPPNQLSSPWTAPAMTQHPIEPLHPPKKDAVTEENALTAPQMVEVLHLHPLGTTRDLGLEKREKGADLKETPPQKKPKPNEV